MALVDRGRVDRELERIGKDPGADATSTDVSPLARNPAGGEGLPQASQFTKDTIIVFDWDDTILPTTWLQRIHNLSGGFMLTPETQALMSSLSAICTETLLLAAAMGTVVIITNSVPGWVDQSCQLFMPQLEDLMKRFNIVARPMRAPLTFKTSAFQREFRMYRNLISIGDGNAERTASLRLQMAPDVVMGALDSNKDMPRSVKSVKLLEMPTCQQLYAEHEMLQQRLADIVGFRGHLDLKSRFPPMPMGMSQCHKVGMCSLVHFARPVGPSSSLGGGASWPSSDDKQMTGVLHLRTITPGHGTGGPTPERSSAGSPNLGGARQGAKERQLPLLGGLGGGASGKSTPEPAEGATATILERLRIEERAERIAGGNSNEQPDGGTEAADNLMQAIGGGIADGADADMNVQRSPGAAEDRKDCDRLDSRGSVTAGGEGAGRRSTTPMLTGSLWKVHGTERGMGRAQSPYTNMGKKRPVMSTGLGMRSAGAVWRENSAPAATRSF